MTKDKRYLRSYYKGLSNDSPLIMEKQYKNYKGAVSLRTLIPVSVRFDEYNEWHGSNVWILDAWDVDKQDFRDFCLHDFL